MVSHTAMFEREDLALLRGAPLFSNVSTDSVEKLIDAGQLRLCDNREILFHPNQPADTVFIVLMGKIQVYRGETAGKHAVLSIMLPGDAFALEAVLDNGRYAATAEAVGTCRLLAIPATAFHKALANGGGLAAGAVRVLSQNLGQAFQQLERIQLKATSQRLADFLLGLIPEQGGTAEFVLPYKKALIANYLGMEPESLSRALKELQDLGVANRGRRVRIADVQRLRAFSTSQSSGTRAA
jgi:CRP/FNR family transcriptional regulator, dissimilatory nitrate respiration regulator